MNKKIFIATFLVVLIVAGAVSAFFLYQKQQDKINYYTPKTSQTQDYIKIPELGVQLKRLPGMEDVSVKIASPETRRGSEGVIYFAFTSKDFEKILKEEKDVEGQKNCLLPNSGYLGTVTQVREYPQPDDGFLIEGSKIVGDGYVSLGTPQDACTENKKVLEVIDSKMALIQKSFMLAEDLNGNLLKNVEQGSLEGSLSYPSEGIPTNLQTCAYNIETKKYFCQQSQYIDKKYKYGKGYLISVPAGKYTVFSTLDPDPKSNKLLRAYYTEFVKCGMTVNCKSHKPIIIEVKDGSELTGIDPWDWYDQDGQDKPMLDENTKPIMSNNS